VLGPLERGLYAQLPALPTGGEIARVFPHPLRQLRLLAALPSLPLGLACLLLLQLVLAGVPIHLATVDLVPREVEPAVLLARELDLLAVDLPRVDPDVNVGLLGVAVYDGETASARKFSL